MGSAHDPHTSGRTVVLLAALAGLSGRNLDEPDLVELFSEKCFFYISPSTRHS